MIVEKLADKYEFPTNFDNILRNRNISRCALVGNGGKVLETYHGAFIDQHSLVMRLNQAPTKGYSKYVGKKVSYRLFNALWTRIYAQSHTRDDGSLDSRKGIKLGNVNGLPLEKNTTIIVSRTSVLLCNNICLNSYYSILSGKIMLHYLLQ